MVELTCSPLGVHRTPRQVRDFDPELCSILFPLTGRLGVIQAGGEATLNALFQRNDTTVSAWIRRQRLEHARRDLGDPAQRTLPVHRIATRWGFNDHSTFTRAFRTAYGVPPNDHRDRSLESAGP